MIDTPGCTIPNVWAEYQIKEADDYKGSCGKRAVFIKRTDEFQRIIFTINKKRMKEFLGDEPYECCSQFGYVLIVQKILKYLPIFIYDSTYLVNST